MDNIKSRVIQKRIEKFLDAKQILVITGMRRVGKTTLLKYYFNSNDSNNKIYLNFEDILTRKLFNEENYENIVRNLAEAGINFDNKSYVYIDEVQYVKNAPSVIKYLYDEYDIKFIVTGSSSYYLKNQFNESLAGRKIIIEVYPLNFSEFLSFKNIQKDVKEKFIEKSKLKSSIRTEKYNDLYNEYLRYGGFPEVVLTDNYDLKVELLRDILTSYFQIDIANLSDFDDISTLRSLLELLTQRVGQKIDFTNLAKLLKVKRQKVYEYVEFLESTYVIKTIPQKSSIDKKVSSINKLYFSDNGLLNILGSISEGSMLENGVFMNLRYTNKLSYFQTSSGKEIDFIIDDKVGLEVKQTPAQKYLSYLKKRADSAGISEYYLVSKYYDSMDRLIMAWDI